MSAFMTSELWLSELSVALVMEWLLKHVLCVSLWNICLNNIFHMLQELNLGQHMETTVSVHSILLKCILRYVLF